MIETLRVIIRGALERLAHQAETELPPLLAAAAVMLVALVFARAGRWLVRRIFHGIALDRFLRRSGLSAMLDRSGTLRASRIVAQTVYWGILFTGFLAALNAFGTAFTGRIVETAILLFPRVLVGGAILLAGVWLGQYLGRGTLVWAVNEDLPRPRRIAVAVRVLVVFAAVVIAADTLNFARTVFLSAFVLVVGGVVLAAGIGLGLGVRDAVRRQFERETAPEEPRERSLWHHL